MATPRHPKHDPIHNPPPPEQTNRDRPDQPGQKAAVSGEGVTTGAGATQTGARDTAHPGHERGGPQFAPGAMRPGTTPTAPASVPIQRGEGIVPPQDPASAEATSSGATAFAPRVESPPPSPGSQGAAEVADPNYTAASEMRNPTSPTAPTTRMDTSTAGGSPVDPAAASRRDKRPEARGPEDVRVGEVMTADVAVCQPDTEIYYVARTMAERDLGAVPVVENTDSMRPIGIVTDRDIVVRGIAKRQDLADLTAGDCMTEQPFTLTPDDTLSRCMELMDQHKVRRIVVVDNCGRCCGIVAQADIARTAPWTQTGHVLMDISQPRQTETSSR